MEDGDANHITEYVKDSFDYVFSSHCLEHMIDPPSVLREWWSLVKPGGVMIIFVPDEDLYEQGLWPSQFNPDHKWTFTISKRKSWSEKSLNLLDLAQSLPDVSSFHIELQDEGYKRSCTCFRRLSFFRRCFRSFKYRVLDHLPFRESALYEFYSHFFPVDQTKGDALAQIQLILHKK